MMLLELEQASYRYPNGGVGLEACSLAIRRGSRNALIGANGSGKTTLFQHCNGLLRPQSGVLRYAGTVLDYSRSGLRQLRSKVGLVFQNPDHQLFSASVQEDVSFGPFNLGLDEATVRRRVSAALDAVGMAGFAERAVHNLSFGQKKRVCIAGVLAMEPELLVLDEPMAGLDHAMKTEFLAVLDGLHAQGITLLLATHDIDLAYRWADYIHLIDSGVCTASLPAADLAYRDDALSALGLPLPTVVELQRRLTARGLLPKGLLPRTHSELLTLLDNTYDGKEAPCC
ncbi:MAG: ABC transporter ATP-binding protein [Propionivibrio sp.]|uniref:energy-coupling factor ABC transporter ATP-binding protein n=1 Tax=Propionivibrio sp. TaxID=2212460 RepID=UPI001A568E4D|nr:ABC transporter ATP-binding protein [Propionivibrio sp.]MBL8416186.1 ABC transporter ATP-binding protein [Propionivibrio sp.]